MMLRDFLNGTIDAVRCAHRHPTVVRCATCRVPVSVANRTKSRLGIACYARLATDAVRFAHRHPTGAGDVVLRRARRAAVPACRELALKLFTTAGAAPVFMRVGARGVTLQELPQQGISARKITVVHDAHFAQVGG